VPLVSGPVRPVSPCKPHPIRPRRSVAATCNAANAVAWLFPRGKRLNSFCWALRCWSSKEIAGLFVSLQQGFDSAAELDIALASLVQKAIALLRRKAESLRKDGNIRIRSTVHLIKRVFFHLAVDFNLRTDDVRSMLRRP
jgi:hypothetical protein